MLKELLLIRFQTKAWYLKESKETFLFLFLRDKGELLYYAAEQDALITQVSAVSKGKSQDSWSGLDHVSEG